MCCECMRMILPRGLMCPIFVMKVETSCAGPSIRATDLSSTILKRHKKTRFRGFLFTVSRTTIRAVLIWRVLRAFPLPFRPQARPPQALARLPQLALPRPRAQARRVSLLLRLRLRPVRRLLPLFEPLFCVGRACVWAFLPSARPLLLQGFQFLLPLPSPHPLFYGGCGVWALALLLP